VEPRWKGLNTIIPVVMVSKSSYSTLVAESFVGGKITMHESSDVNATIWETLEKLGDKEVSLLCYKLVHEQHILITDWFFFSSFSSFLPSFAYTATAGVASL
jgi:hypothetical protein